MLADDFAVEGEKVCEDFAPGILRGDELADPGVARLEIGATGFLDGGGERGGGVFARPEGLVAVDDAVHVAAVDADDRCAAGLRFERHEAEGFLHAGVDENVRGAVVRGELGGVGAVGQVGDR